MTQRKDVNTSQDPRSVKSRAGLAQALWDLLQDYRFEEITVAMLSDKAGLSRLTFYNQFPDKNSLLDYMFSMRSERMHERISTAPIFMSGSKLLKYAVNDAINYIYMESSDLGRIIKADKNREVYYAINQFIHDMILDCFRSYDFVSDGHDVPKELIASMVSGALCFFFYNAGTTRIPFDQLTLTQSMLSLVEKGMEISRPDEEQILKEYGEKKEEDK